MDGRDLGPVGEKLKERALDEAPLGITITDPDRSDNPLIYVNESFEELTGYDATEVLGRNCRFLQGEGTEAEPVAELREAIDAAEPVTVELLNYRKDGEPFWNEVTVAPVRDEDGAVTNYVGFQVDVTERREAQDAVAAERERLDRVLERINGLLADVTELLMHGVERAETERAIVERIAATDSYAACWVGQLDLARDVLETSSAAGFAESLDGFTVDLSADSPTARAYRTDEAVIGPVEEGLARALGGPAGPSGDGSRARADARPDHPSADRSGDRPANRMAALPLSYGDATYGVLSVVGVDADALDDRELVVLESLAGTIATAINAAQSRRGLVADDHLELEFTVTDGDFFPLALARAGDCRLEYRGSTTGEDRGIRLFLERVDEAESVGKLPEVSGVRSVTAIGGPAGLLEVELPPGSIVDRLAERGAEVRALRAEPGVAEITVAVPAEVGARVVRDVLAERFDGVDLVAHRERGSRPTTRREFLAVLEDRLTERQATALYSAYFSGYYDAPRQTSGDELAAAMGVSRSTFHQHLRAAERKLLAAILGGEQWDPDAPRPVDAPATGE